MLAQVVREAKRVVARLDKAEEQTLQRHATDQERVRLSTTYSLGHKVCYLQPSLACSGPSLTTQSMGAGPGGSVAD